MSSTASSETPEAKEINLVGNVEMRIALTDTDAKLESILKVYLAPLLLKLASNHLSVRNKVRRDLYLNWFHSLLCSRNSDYVTLSYLSKEVSK